MTLQELHNEIDAAMAAATSENVKLLLRIDAMILEQLTQPASTGDSGDLQKRIDWLNAQINNQADLLHQIGKALEADDLTAVQLVARAGEIMTELNNRRKGKL